MRLGAFVLGGLVGAAAVIYLSDRKNRSMTFSAFTSPMDTLGKMMGGNKDLMNKTMNAFTNNTNTANNQKPNAATAGIAQSAAAGNTHTASNTASYGANGLSQVQKIVSEDPELRKTVNDILQDSGKGNVNLQ